MPILETIHLSKTYDKTQAVKDLNLTLETGDIFGFIGPNGAGKTTTIKMLATLLKPTAGSAMIDGINVADEPDAVRSIIGYMPDFFGVYDDMKVWEYLDFFAAAYKISGSKRPAIVSDVLELVDLSSRRNSLVEELSRGMKQRLGLARSLVHDPKVLLLDEPASGLDPRSRIEIRTLLRELKAMGKTILISSHILPELADFCTKIGIIENGEMIISGPIDEIMRQVTGGKILIVKLVNQVQEAAKVLTGQPGVRKVGVVGNELQVETELDVDNSKLVRLLFDHGMRIDSFAEQAIDLEDVFLKVTSGVAP